MHVLVAAHDTYPDPGSGGTGRYVYETARRLADRGHRVSVITRRRGAVPRQEAVAGVEVHRYDVTVAGATAPAIARQLPRARRQVRESVAALSGTESPGVVSFQGPLTSALVDRAVADAVPRVTTFHSPWPTEYDVRTGGGPDRSALRQRANVGLRRLLEGRLLRRSDRVITLSAFMRDQLRRVYGSAVDATVVPGGVDAAQFTPDAETYDPMAGDELAFLTVRRLAERMGHDRLIDAFERISDARPEARLYVAGDGPLRDRLENLADRRGVADRTTFLGYVPDDDLPAAYATADVFVLPTQRLEGFGLATLEALAAGTPVVATPVGGTVEILSGLGEGLPAEPLVDSPDADALAAGLDAWAALQPSTREQAGDACRRFAREEYGWDRTVAGLLGIYEQSLS